MPIISTSRLIFREFSTEDAEDMFALNSNPKVIKYTGDKAFSSLEETIKVLINYDQYQKYGFGRWAVVDKATNSFLGWCGLKYHPESDEVDLGYRFFEEHWGKGLATESSQACLEYGFKEIKLNRIIGRVVNENIASIKVLKKLDFQFCKSIDFDGMDGSIFEKYNPKDIV